MTEVTKPQLIEYLSLEECRISINMVEWTALEAACYLQGIRPISYEVFMLNRAFYADIDYYFKKLTGPFNTRMKKGDV